MNSLQSVGSSALLSKIAALRSQPGPARDAEMQQFQDALSDELQKTLTPAVTGWTTPQVSKPAFPYQVNRQASHYGPIARAQVTQNMANAIGLLGNPAVASALLVGVESRLDPQAKPTPHDLSDPEFKRFYEAVREAGGQSGNFTTMGSLVMVGWGSGDHISVGSNYLPTGPEWTGPQIASSVTQQFFA